MGDAGVWLSGGLAAESKSGVLVGEGRDWMRERAVTAEQSSIGCTMFEHRSSLSVAAAGIAALVTPRRAGS